MSKDYYHSEAHRPFHLSVGLVIVNDKGEFLSKHFSDFRGQYENLYLFPTETVEKDESLEQTLSRALIEEVGIQALPIGSIGSIVGTIPRHGHAVQRKQPYTS